MKNIILPILFLVLPTWIFAQSKTIDKWAEKKGVRKLCFYPTTLRMINISKDETFYELIENVDKLRIYIIDDKAGFKKQDLSELKKGILNENFKDMIQVQQGKRSFFVYIREKHNKPVGFAGISFSEESVVLIDLEGYISPENIQKIIEGKMNMGALNQLYDISKQTQKK
jgi:hypothetical protein